MAQEMEVTTSMQHMLIKPKRLVVVKPIMEGAVTCLQSDPMGLLLKTFAKQAIFKRGLLLKTFSKQAIFEMEEWEERNRMFSRILVSHMTAETTNAKEAISFYKAAFGAKEFSQWIIGKEPYLAAEMNLRGIHIQIYDRANV